MNGSWAGHNIIIQECYWALVASQGRPAAVALRGMSWSGCRWWRTPRAPRNILKCLRVFPWRNTFFHITRPSLYGGTYLWWSSIILFLKGSILIEKAIIYTYIQKNLSNNSFLFLMQIDVLRLLFSSYYKMYFYFSDSLSGIDTSSLWWRYFFGSWVKKKIEEINSRLAPVGGYCPFQVFLLCS